MASDEQLFQNFSVSEEVLVLAKGIHREIKAKTGPGSGHDLKGLATGLVAVSVFVACQRSNSNEIVEKVAQVASCLHSKDFKELLKIVYRVLETDSFNYSDLHDKYKTILLRDDLAPFIQRAEEELLRTGVKVERNGKLFICAVFFWVASTAKPKLIPVAKIFAQENTIAFPKLKKLLEALDENSPNLHERIQTAFTRPSSPTKASRTSTPSRPSPRKTALRDMPTKDSPKKTPQPTEAPETEAESSIRRSSRIQATIQDTPTKSKASPRPPWKSGPLRDLPSRDSPKKRTVQVVDPEEPSDAMDVDAPLPETPTKKRKLDSSTVPPLQSLQKSIFPTPKATTSAQQPMTPTRTQRGGGASRPSSPLKQNVKGLRNNTVATAAEEEEATEEEESEEDEDPVLARRRFRPVYQDYQQWREKDPRLNRIWRKAFSLSAQPVLAK